MFIAERFYLTEPFYVHEQVLQKPSVEARQQLTVLSRNVATAVSEIVHAAEAIKGRQLLLDCLPFTHVAVLLKEQTCVVSLNHVESLSAKCFITVTAFRVRSFTSV